MAIIFPLNLLEIKNRSYETLIEIPIQEEPKRKSLAWTLALYYFERERDFKFIWNRDLPKIFSYMRLFLLIICATWWLFED